MSVLADSSFALAIPNDILRNSAGEDEMRRKEKKKELLPALALLVRKKLGPKNQRETVMALILRGDTVATCESCVTVSSREDRGR